VISIYSSTQEFNFIVVNSLLDKKTILDLASVAQKCQELRSIYLVFGGKDIGRGLLGLFRMLNTLPKLNEVSVSISSTNRIETKDLYSINEVCYKKKGWILQVAGAQESVEDQFNQMVCLAMIIFMVIRFVTSGNVWEQFQN